MKSATDFSTDDADVFIVEEILKHKVTGKGKNATTLYYIKWQGYDNPKDNTWEPAQNIAPKLVRKYHELLKKGKKGPRGLSLKKEQERGAAAVEQKVVSSARKRGRPRKVQPNAEEEAKVIDDKRVSKKPKVLGADTKRRGRPPKQHPKPKTPTPKVIKWGPRTKKPSVREAAYLPVILAILERRQEPDTMPVYHVQDTLRATHWYDEEYVKQCAPVQLKEFLRVRESLQKRDTSQGQASSQQQATADSSAAQGATADEKTSPEAVTSTQAETDEKAAAAVVNGDSETKAMLPGAADSKHSSEPNGAVTAPTDVAQMEVDSTKERSTEEPPAEVVAGADVPVNSEEQTAVTNGVSPMQE